MVALQASDFALQRCLYAAAFIVTLLTVTQLSKQFRSAEQVVRALDDISFAVEAGEFVTIIGSSGCGKSTLLRILTGIVPHDAGQILLDGADVGVQETRRGLFGYMPQRDALLPWRTVLDNVTLGAELDGRDVATAQAEAKRLLPLFGLDGFEQAWPPTLSGGMRQRAALLRTFLTERDILLLDEPFGALDALTRRELQRWLLDLRRNFHKTILFITHDIDEALLLADRVLVFSARPGRIVADLRVELPSVGRETQQFSPPFLHYKQQLVATLGLA